jgi:hypothetical protein
MGTDILARIAQCGGLDQAVAAAAHAPGREGLEDLLAEQTRLAGVRDPRIAAASLRRQADWKAAAAEKALRQTADDLGRAAGLLRDGRQGEDLYTTLLNRGHGAEARADRLLKDRMALLEEAAGLEASLATADAIAGVAR